MPKEQSTTQGGLSPKISFTLGFLVGTAIFGIIGLGLMYSVLQKNKKTDTNAAAAINEQKTDNQELPASQVASLPAGIDGVTTFFDSGEPACKVEAKPVLRLFSTTWCPHCQWIKETFDKVAKDYTAQGGIKAYHWEVDTGDNTLTDEVEAQVPAEEMAIYSKFNPRGSIPTFVFGCKYWRVGNGYEQQDDLASEEAEFRAVIEELLK